MLILLFSSGCMLFENGEVKMGTPSSPTIEIVSPKSSDLLYSDTEVTFSVVVKDDSDLPDELSVVWSSDVDGVFEFDKHPNSDGEHIATGFLSEGSHVLTVTVQDGDDQQSAVSQSVTVLGPEEVLNEAPKCQLHPLAREVYPVLTPIDFSAEISDAETLSTVLTVQWSSDLDGDLGMAAADSSGVVQIQPALQTIGEHTIKVLVTDEQGATCTDALTLYVDALPVVDILLPTTDILLLTGDRLTVKAQVIHETIEASAFQYSVVSSLEGEWGSALETSDGTLSYETPIQVYGEHTVQVIADGGDGFIGSDWVNVVYNGRPTIRSVTVTPQVPTGNDTVKCTASAVDEDGGYISYDFSWVNVTTNQGYVSSSVIGTSAYLNLNTIVMGQEAEFACEVTVSDAYGTTDFLSVPFVVMNH